jgi:hypothetical protein
VLGARRDEADPIVDRFVEASVNGNGSKERPCLTLIPVYEIHDREGVSMDIALEIFGI